MPRPGTSAASSDFVLQRNSVIPASGISGGYGNVSKVQEPSTDNNGKYVFQTGNWYASYSNNNGANWTYLNPFSIFGANFCCDQVTIYDAARGKQYWELQYVAAGSPATNKLVLAEATGTNLASWCYYNITPDWFGEPADTAIDYNDLSLTNNYLYLASNLFPKAGGSKSGLIRMPLDSLSTCAGFTYNRYVTATYFTLKGVQGATDVAYFGSDGGGTLRSSFRIIRWPEVGSLTTYDRTVAAFTYFSRSSGQNCTSADGAVTNWCQYADSRTLGGAKGRGYLNGTGFVSGNYLSWSFNAKQSGTARPFPYSRLVSFRESDLSYSGAVDFAATWGAIQFLTLAPNARGDIGGAFAWGGGTGTTHYFPSSAAFIWDDYGYTPNYYLWGTGNTCTSSGIPRWGDYYTARAWKPSMLGWIAVGWAYTGGNCGSGGTDAPHNIVFSRSRDTTSITRYWNN